MKGGIVEIDYKKEHEGAMLIVKNQIKSISDLIDKKHDLIDENERLKKENLIQKQMITDLSLLNEKQHHLFVQTVNLKHKEYSKLKKKYKKLKGDK